MEQYMTLLNVVKQLKMDPKYLFLIYLINKEKRLKPFQHYNQVGSKMSINMKKSKYASFNRSIY